MMWNLNTNMINHIIIYAGVGVLKVRSQLIIIETINNFIFDGPVEAQLTEAKDYLKK